LDPRVSDVDVRAEQADQPELEPLPVSAGAEPRGLEHDVGLADDPRHFPDLSGPGGRVLLDHFRVVPEYLPEQVSLPVDLPGTRVEEFLELTNRRLDVDCVLGQPRLVAVGELPADLADHG